MAHSLYRGPLASHERFDRGGALVEGTAEQIAAQENLDAAIAALDTVLDGLDTEARRKVDGLVAAIKAVQAVGSGH
jgi:hypothetical protein